MLGKHVFLLGGLLAALRGWRGVAADDDVVVKVMSFNVRTSEASVDKNHRCSNWFGERRGFVVAQFRSVDADFVGTQETTDEQRGVLDGDLKEKYSSIGKSSGSLNGAAAEVNAIYYRHQDWKLLADGMFWLTTL
ncbi:hypothetical protein P43SY_008802 [Pythium insidiosum]|uniref:Endonuclease/exonuclease/phosphatase domain-containing protein n=1 Tax=Pythium insidiosum TaxID=114742 RepID=A0AAD5LKY0_PYTIN|nr:hypothetical protein P43SY_008802 [Pythium insidiosum]